MCLWDVASGGVNAIFSDIEVELRHVFMMVAKLCISMLQRGTHLLKFWFLSVLLFEMELGNGGGGGGGRGAGEQMLCCEWLLMFEKFDNFLNQYVCYDLDCRNLLASLS